MSNESAQHKRVPTGIHGLDPILEGGLLEGGVYIVQGPPGAGKTILANQVCFSHARQGHRAVYITLLAESHTRMLAHLRRMSFFSAALIPDSVYYLSAFKVLEEDGLPGLLTSLRRAVTAHQATLLILDGMSSAEEASPSTGDYKKFIHELQAVTAMTSCTAILLSSTERPRPFHPEDTMVDGIIELSDELREQRSLRFLQVRKMRGTAPVRGRHTMEIGNDGIVVRRRFETQLLPVTEQPETTTEPPRMSFGIARLDQMLHGGVPASSVTMLLGPSGTGKTALGLQFLAEGARRGEPGVHFGFYERPQRLLVKSRQLGLGLETAVQSGLVQLVWHRPVEGIIDQLSEHLIGEVRRTGARRVFVDGINGFELSVDTPERIRDVYAGLASELEKAGVTTIYTMESIDLLGPRIELPIGGLSAITHNILVLRHVELEATLRRSLCILKLRDSGHESIICELRITPTGLDVVDSFGRATNILSGTAYLGPDAPPHTVGPDPGTRTPGGRKA